MNRIIKALTSLGLSSLEADVYTYLAKKGSLEAVTLASALNCTRHQIHSSLKTLITKGLITKDRTIFSALPFEEALDLLIKRGKEQAQAMHESKKELLTTWKTKE